MTIETIRDSLCINQIVEQRKDSFIIEGDAIIPDVKPDILGTISTSGTVCIYKKEIQDGKIKIDGTINTYIMYLADSESNNIRSINTNLDFSQTINTEKAKIKAGKQYKVAFGYDTKTGYIVDCVITEQ